MRISDWSSDVCSSDLTDPGTRLRKAAAPRRYHCRPPCPQRPRRGAGDTGNGWPRWQGSLFDPDRDRKSVVEGKSVSVRVDLGGRRIIKKKIKINIRDSRIKTDQISRKTMKHTS